MVFLNPNNNEHDLVDDDITKGAYNEHSASHDVSLQDNTAPYQTNSLNAPSSFDGLIDPFEAQGKKASLECASSDSERKPRVKVNVGSLFGDDSDKSQESRHVLNSDLHFKESNRGAHFKFANVFDEAYVKDTDTFEKASDDDTMAICGDSLAVLKTMKDKSVDLIFADPPYNLHKDFGNKSDCWDNEEDFIAWNISIIDECMRVLKDNGTMYLMSATQFMPYFDIHVSKKYHMISRIIWHYDSSGKQATKRFGSLYEPILMFTKGKKSKYTFNSDDIKEATKTGFVRGLIDYRANPPKPYSMYKVPGNACYFPRVRFRQEQYESHPSQKPEELLERIVKASSNAGDLVLDPFAGAFTTCTVAKRLKRKSFGIDCNKEYFKAGLRRTEITDVYEGEVLIKNKERKTKALSKKVRSVE